MGWSQVKLKSVLESLQVEEINEVIEINNPCTVLNKYSIYFLERIVDESDLILRDIVSHEGL